MKKEFKLNDNIEFLERSIKNWRYGKIIEINSNRSQYKIYSGTDIFWVKPVVYKNNVQLETV
jgi:hypothetical protein